jgi:hypothetical protein
LQGGETLYSLWPLVCALTEEANRISAHTNIAFHWQQADILYQSLNRVYAYKRFYVSCRPAKKIEDFVLHDTLRFVFYAMVGRVRKVLFWPSCCALGGRREE